MFLFGNSKQEIDPEKLTVMQLAKAMEKGVLEKDVPDVLELTIAPEQYKKMVDSIEKFVFDDSKKTEFNKHSLMAYRKGIFYGLALSTKLQIDARDLEPDFQKDGIGHASVTKNKTASNVARKYAFIFWAIEHAYNNWTDDEWFKNLMKNVKIEDLPAKKPKKK